MKVTLRFFAFSCLVSISATGFLVDAAQAQERSSHIGFAGQQKRMVGYLPEWSIYSGFYPKNLVANGSAEKLTHVLYAFANLPAPATPGAGTCQLGDPWADYEVPVSAADSIDGVADAAGNTLHGNFNQLLKLKKLHPNLKVLISIGGWTWSSGFSVAASTDASRKALVSSCISTYIEGRFRDPQDYDVTQPGIFDGIDIDWEFPGTCGNTCDYSPDDTENFTLLLQEFRRQLDAESAKTHTRYELSIAAPASQSEYSLIQLSKIPAYLNFINLMTYDLNGTWNNYADHAAPLFTSRVDPIAADQGNSVHAAVSAYLSAGVPNEKINAGIPFYGHGWVGVPGKNNGLYQSATGGAPLDQANYNVLKSLSSFTHHYDPLSGLAHWIYNPQTKTFYSYDDDLAVFVKALYVRARGLGGAMFWDLSGDDIKGTLINSIHAGLHGRCSYQQFSDLPTDQF
jgi:chitinase